MISCCRADCEHSELVFSKWNLYCFHAFELFASTANSRFQQGFYNAFWLPGCLRAYRIRVFDGDSILFVGFRAVCEHSEFLFSMWILYCFLAPELFASIAISRFRRGFYNVFLISSGLRIQRFAFSTWILQCFLASELFANIANSCFQMGFYNVLRLSSCLRAQRIRILRWGFYIVCWLSSCLRAQRIRVFNGD